MELILYKNISEKSKVGKTLSSPQTMSGVLHGESSVVDPIILVTADESIVSYNYLYAKEFGRYYFITNIVAVRNGLFRIEAHVDVLESYKDGIRKLSAIIDKQETDRYNKYLDNGEWVASCKTFSTVVNFPNGFNDNGEYVLLVAGG